MKHHPHLLIAALLTACGIAFHLRAQTPAPPAKPTVVADPFVKNPGVEAIGDDGLWKNLLLVLEVYALDKNDALAVLESERGSGARYRRVVELAANGKARLDTLTALPTKSGQKAVTESVDEVIYPTEYNAASSKGGLATPITFYTRYVGDMVEIEPVLGPDGHTCEISMVPQHVSLVGFRDFGGMPDDPRVSQPFFNTQKLTMTTSLQCNEPHYLGSLTPPREAGLGGGANAEVWLAFVRINLIAPTAAEMKPPAKPMDWSALDLEYSFYSLDRAAAREILIAPPGIHAPWKELQALLAEKKASFEHIVSVKTKSGQKATAEEIQEVRYSTESKPPSLARSTETTTRTTTSRPGLVISRTPDPATDMKATTTTESATVVRELPNADGARGTPASMGSFETRNAGMTIEVEPVVGPDSMTIELSHALRGIGFLGDLKTTGVAAQYPAQPLFEARTITTSMTILGGQHTLAGTFNPPGADGVNDRTDTGRTWLVFVRAVPNDP